MNEDDRLDPILQSRFSLLDQLEPTELWPRVTATATPAQQQRRSWRRVVVVAAALVIAAVGIALWLADNESVGQPDVVVEPPTTSLPTTSTSTSTTLPPMPTTTLDLRFDLDPGPLSPRVFPSIVHTPDSVVVYAGDRGPSDGAIFDRESQRWARMAPAPLPTVQFGAWAGAWVDGRVAIAHDSQLAFYTPSTDSWSEAIELAHPVSELTYESDSRVMIRWWTEQFTVFTMTSDKVLPVEVVGQVVVDSRRGELAWTGSEVLEVSNLIFPINEVYRVRSWQPRLGWTELAEVTEASAHRGQIFSVAWIDDKLWLVNEGNAVSTYEPATATWSDLPPMPVNSYEAFPYIHQVDDHVVVESNPAAAVFTGDRWEVHQVDDGAIFGTVGAGLDGVSSWWTYGTLGVDSGENQFRATPLPTPGVIDTVLVGYATHDLAPGESLVDMALIGGAVEASIRVANGSTCLVTHIGPRRPADPVGRLLEFEDDYVTVWCAEDASYDDVIQRVGHI